MGDDGRYGRHHPGDEGSQEGQSRSRQGSLALLFWVTAVLILGFLPIALYVPYMFSGVSGANPSPAATPRLVCDPTCLGASGERLLRDALADYGGLGSLQLEFSSTIAKDLGFAKVHAPPTTEAPRPTYLVVGGPAAAAMTASGLVTSPVSEAMLRRPFRGPGSVVGEVILYDPLVLVCNTDLLARAGFGPGQPSEPGLGTWPEVMAVVQKMRLARPDTKGEASPPLATMGDLFVAVLYQNRGRLCDSEGEPLFQFSAGQAALRMLSRLIGAAGDSRSTTALLQGPAAGQAFASGRLPMLITTRSFATDPSLAEKRNGISILPLPQTLEVRAHTGVPR